MCQACLVHWVKVVNNASLFAKEVMLASILLVNDKLIVSYQTNILVPKHYYINRYEQQNEAEKL